MNARALLLILAAAVSAGAAVLWMALARSAPDAQPVERLELPTPTRPARAAAERERASARDPAASAGESAPPEAGLAAEPAGDPLIVGAVPRPDPGSRHGPLATEHYAGGQLMYEAQQRRLDDGAWLLDGMWTSWHANGQLQEQGAYRDEAEHGPWQWWAENGTRVAAGTFDQGFREGPWSFWYESGTKLMDATYAGGEGVGLWTMYHENGRKAAEGEYLHGEISGPWTIWREDGSIDPDRSGTYEAGVRVGR